ncbi:MAG: endopeptidase La [Candidatus Pacebacteria bacterium]|nr:endopeptidase La [Candidatus Paceibacterota bacterium]
MIDNTKPPQDNKPKTVEKTVTKVNKVKKIPNLEKEIKELEKMTQDLFGKSKSGNPSVDLVEQSILPIIPIKEGVLYPSTESVLTFGRKLSQKSVRKALKGNKLVVLVTQRKSKVENPKVSDLYTIGTLAILEKALDTNSQLNVLARGIERVGIIKYIKQNPFYGQVKVLKEVNHNDSESEALAKHLQQEFHNSIQMGRSVEFLSFMKLMSGASQGELTDQIASTLSSTTHEKQEILETLDVKERMKIVAARLSHEIEILKIEKDVVNKTQSKMSKSMRENVLRERLRTIQKELGEIDDEAEIADDYTKKLKKIKCDPEIKKKVAKEIRKVKQMSPYNPEAGYIRSWLDTFFEMPWGKLSKGNYDLKKAEKILEKNHYGLPKVKERILEFIAVMQMKQIKKDKLKGKAKSDQTIPTILCFVGPPGVGKTSIGKSVAESLGRKFTKVSLGGIRDEAEIRGHRRTYVGAMPGRIVNGIKQAGTMNPVFMLDEVDKLASDYKGDPSAALLEALDPEQNHGFEDHYLDLPFDLSQVLFITTANTLDTIPPALRDRLEIITYTGYTGQEKFHIAHDHLLDKVMLSNGLTNNEIKVEDTAFEKIISRYTREAGVRDLERNLSKVLRKTARELLENKSKKVTIDNKKIRELLGPERFDETLTEKENEIGLSTGLAWTSVGGDMLFIEVALTPGKGLVKLTGKLGDVMKESAQTALTYVKANSKKLGISDAKLAKHNVHIHVPEGAVPKDGPSAGVTITTAIVSAFTKKPVNREVAMTGEVTLRGRVLRIGGLKEKSIAAHRAGSKTVIIPQDNERDLEEVPDSVKKVIKFIPVGHVDQVLEIALC